MKDFSDAELLEAVTDSGAIISEIARRLSVDWHTAKKYTEKFPDALEAEREQTLDGAEQCIINAMRAGDLPVCKWYLSTKGRSRGYTTERELEQERAIPEIKSIAVKYISPAQAQLDRFMSTMSEDAQKIFTELLCECEAEKREVV